MNIGKRSAGRTAVAVLAFVALSLCGYVSAHAAGQPIGWLKEFSGDVLIKNKGAWGTNPKVGLPLYSDDKIVTKDGKARVEFHDGAVMEIAPFANCLIKESEKKGWLWQSKSVERSFRLFLGKIRVVTGKGSSVRTQLATPTAVCGARGTDVTISLDAEGRPYIYFTEGTGTNLTDFINGIAPGMTAEQSAMNPVQRAAYLADLAARQAAAAGASDAQTAYNNALAAAAAAAEILAASRAYLPEPGVELNSEQQAIVDEMQDLIDTANILLRDAQTAMAAAMQNGAVPTGGIDSQTILDNLQVQINETQDQVDTITTPPAGDEPPIEDSDPPSPT